MSLSQVMHVAIIIAILFTFVSFQALSSPLKHIRRSAVAFNGHNAQSGILVSTTIEEEADVDEVKVEGNCENSFQTFMNLYKLTGRDAATCNDGSEAGYYLLEQAGSQKWVVYLEGGWYCSNKVSCEYRKRQVPLLTSSRKWNSCKEGDGIFSTVESENPHLFDSNMVYIPYCSSDAWSGTSKNQVLGDETYSFMGSVIVEQVIKKLIANHGMRNATMVVLAGSSAGGTGVFMNIDRVQRIVDNEGLLVTVQGVVDSAWFLTRPPMDDDVRCQLPYDCSPVAMLKLGVSLWRPNIPEKCVNTHRRGRYNAINSDRRLLRDERWKCFFGSVVYPYIAAEVFIIQWLFDTVQLQYDNKNLMERSTNESLVYIESLYEELNQSFRNVRGVFATSCLAHTILDHNNWNSISVSGSLLSDAINCWQDNLSSTSDKVNTRKKEIEVKTNQLNSPNVQRRHHHDRELSNENIRNRQASKLTSDVAPDGNVDYISYANRYLKGTPKPPTNEPTQCTQKVIDPCPLPQCNPTCLRIYDPQSRSYINAVDFIQNLGINLRSIASNEESNAARLLNILNQD